MASRIPCPCSASPRAGAARNSTLAAQHAASLCGRPGPELKAFAVIASSFPMLRPMLRPMPGSNGRGARLASLMLLAALACGEPAEKAAPPAPVGRDSAPPDTAAPPPGTPPTAKYGVFAMLRADQAAKRSPSDGGGRAWLVPGAENSKQVQAGSSARFHLVYEVGPLGVATGGGVYLQVSPFWGWSTPQVEQPEAPGYTEVKASAKDIEIAAKPLGPQ